MAMSFESRLHRFLWIGNISLGNERAFSFFRLKHIPYLFSSIIMLWRSLNGSPSLLFIGSSLGILGILSPILSKGSMSFEARMIALLISSFESFIDRRRKEAR